MSIITNISRNGNFTSSGIFNLTVNPKSGDGLSETAKKYIAKKNLERKLGRSLELNKQTNSTRWGTFCEQIVNDKLELNYVYQSDKTLVHPEFNYWLGSPDSINKIESVVADIKCYEPENFAEYLDVLYKNDVELFKKEYTKEYWQLCSNACICDCKYMEAIVYMPYESDIPMIKRLAEATEEWQYRFIVDAKLHELPYLPNDNKYYKDLNIVRFEVPEVDKKALTERVIKAGEYLIKTNDK